MSSCVITKTAAATSATRCSFRDADVTSMFIRSSIDIPLRSGMAVLRLAWRREGQETEQHEKQEPQGLGEARRYRDYEQLIEHRVVNVQVDTPPGRRESALLRVIGLRGRERMHKKDTGSPSLTAKD